YPRLSRRRRGGRLTAKCDPLPATLPEPQMSDAASPDVKQQRMKEFVSLLPLTLEIARLPRADAARRLDPPHPMEARVLSIRTAYKLARTLLKEVGEGT